MTTDKEYQKILRNANFIKMLAANDKLTSKSKVQALKNLISRNR